jgi:hypothetical protein
MLLQNIFYRPNFYIIKRLPFNLGRRYSLIGPEGEIRTLTEKGLSLMTLPVGLPPVNTLINPVQLP